MLKLKLIKFRDLNKGWLKVPMYLKFEMIIKNDLSVQLLIAMEYNFILECQCWLL